MLLPSSVRVSQLGPEVSLPFFSPDYLFAVLWSFLFPNTAFSRVSLPCCSRKGISRFLPQPGDVLHICPVRGAALCPEPGIPGLRKASLPGTSC